MAKVVVNVVKKKSAGAILKAKAERAKLKVTYIEFPLINLVTGRVKKMHSADKFANEVNTKGYVGKFFGKFSAIEDDSPISRASFEFGFVDGSGVPVRINMPEKYWQRLSEELPEMLLRMKQWREFEKV